MPVYIPLRPGEKTPSVNGWSSPEYQGVEHKPGDWHGMRCDGLVVVDFDSDEALAYGSEMDRTLTVRTPRGLHLIYRHTPGSPEGPAVGVFPGVDIRAGRGSYIVAPDAPDRIILHSILPAPFNPSWLPAARSGPSGVSQEWDRVGEGRRNNTLAAVGGALRKQGASATAIARALVVLNEILLEEPLPREEVLQTAASIARYDPRPDVEIVLT